MDTERSIQLPGMPLCSLQHTHYCWNADCDSQLPYTATAPQESAVLFWFMLLEDLPPVLMI